jgi:small subunit ribosomal protein S20
MRDSIKTIKKMALAKNFDEAEKKLATVYKSIDKAAKRGVIKKNTAARKKSRVVLFIKKLQTKSKEK